MCIYAGVDRALEVSQGSPYWCTSRDAMPVSARLSRQDTRWYTLRKQVQGEAGALQTGACTHRVACYVGYAWQHSHCMLVIGSICSAYISKCLVMAPNHAQDTQFHAFSTWIDVTCQENVLPASALELGVIKTEKLSLNIHICIPLVGGSVEKAPAGCILRCHHTLIQTTQHGHYIVLDGACNCKVLKKLGPVVKPHIIRIHCCVINQVVCVKLYTGGFKKCQLTCISCTRR